MDVSRKILLFLSDSPSVYVYKLSHGKKQVLLQDYFSQNGKNSKT